MGHIQSDDFREEVIAQLRGLELERSKDSISICQYEDQERLNCLQILTLEQRLDNQLLEQESQMREYKADVERLNSDYATLVKEKEQMVELSVEMSRQLQELRKQYAESLNAHKVLQKQSSERYDKFQKQFEEELVKSRGFQQEAMNVQMQLNNALNDKLAAFADVQRLQNQLDKLQGSSTTTASKMSNELEKQIGEYKKKVIDLEKHEGELESEVKELNQELAKQKKTKQNVAQTDKRYTEMKERLAELENSNAEAEAKAKQLESDSNALLSSNSELQSMLDRAKADLQSEKNRSRNKIDAVNKKLRAFTATKEPLSEPSLLLTPGTKSVYEPKIKLSNDAADEKHDEKTAKVLVNNRRTKAVPLATVNGNVQQRQTMPQKHKELENSMHSAEAPEEENNLSKTANQQKKKKRKLGVSKKPLIVEDDAEQLDFSMAKTKPNTADFFNKLPTPIPHRQSIGGKLISPLKKRNEGLRDLFKF
ncbi:hypothetical protein V1512DRAFT_252718 [Lipomyces arxii]|uniref:uncharacterized protein n=1 Tax=Lipomyces arxii TaxID=56418 RepID=UPI0034CE7611